VRRLLALVLLVVGTAGCAARGKPASSPYEGYDGIFPSGMRLVVYGFREMSGPTAVHVSYRVGAAEEPPGQEGIRELAHRLSALTRAEGPESPSLVDRLKASGAGFSGETSTDETHYTALNASLQLPRLLELEALRMRDPLAHVTEAEFLATRDAFAEELHRRPPAMDALELMRSELLKGHPYGRPERGLAASVRALTLDAVRTWARTHYTPDRALLVVMGPLPPAQVVAAVTESFGALAAGPPAKPTRSAPPPLPEALPLGRVVKRPSAVGYPQLWMVWRAPGLPAGRYVEARMMADLLRDRVLPWMTYTRQRGTFARAAEAGLWSADGVTLHYLMLEVGHGEDPEPIVDAAKLKLRLLWADWAHDLKLRDQHTALFESARQEAQALSPYSVAWYMRMSGQADLRGWPKRVRDTSLSDVRAYGHRYLDLDDAAILLLVPPEDMDLKGPPKI
jgi:zinc protease